MGYFDDWFGELDGGAYLEGWFDPDAGTPPAPSANGGSSKARILGTLAPRPQVPPWRHLDGPNGVQHTEVRRYLSDINSRDVIFGNHVEVTFADAATAVRVDTGLGGPCRGYKIVSSNCDADRKSVV